MLPNSGQISLSQVQTEFGGSNPVQLSEYKNNNHGGPLANAGTLLWGQWDGKYRLGGMHGRKSGGYEGLGVGSGSWTVPAGTIRILNYLVGGGGGGALFYFSSVGFGGGSGGLYWPADLTASGSYAPGQSVSYAVGGGGAGAVGGGSNGGNGTGSSFGPTAVVGGGEGGVYGTRGGYGGSPGGGQGGQPTGGSAGLGGPGNGGDGAPVFGNGSNGAGGTMYIRWYS